MPPRKIKKNTSKIRLSPATVANHLTKICPLINSSKYTLNACDAVVSAGHMALEMGRHNLFCNSLSMIL
jgi:hypothetical protein